MRLLPVILAAARAQLDIPGLDLDNFDLSAFGLGPAAGGEIVFPGAAEDDERYFFTTTVATAATTTTVATQAAGSSCWKCDEMTYANCAANGKYTLCSDAENDCCFVEVRETRTALKQLCTGCKQKSACMDLKAQNFVTGRWLYDQCRPDYRSQSHPRFHNARHSVCRQCFATCEPNDFNGAKCFGGINVNTPVNFMLLWATGLAAGPSSGNWAWSPPIKPSEGDHQVFGIPTGALLDGTLDAALITDIQNKDSHLNVYFPNTTNGKITLSTGAAANNARSTAEMVWWSLEGATNAWWSSDIKAIYMASWADSIASCTAPASTTGVQEFTACASAFTAAALG